jgi:predicted transcriptional regulator
MRTTVTLEPDLAKRLRDLAHRNRASFKATINQVLRRGLAAQETKSDRKRPRFVVQAHSGGFRPGIDLERLNQLVDQLETEDFLREARSR